MWKGKTKLTNSLFLWAVKWPIAIPVKVLSTFYIIVQDMVHLGDEVCSHNIIKNISIHNDRHRGI